MCMPLQQPTFRPAHPEPKQTVDEIQQLVTLARTTAKSTVGSEPVSADDYVDEAMMEEGEGGSGGYFV